MFLPSHNTGLHSGGLVRTNRVVVETLLHTELRKVRKEGPSPSHMLAKKAILYLYFTPNPLWQGMINSETVQISSFNL